METSREQKDWYLNQFKSRMILHIIYVAIKTVRDNTNVTHWFKQVLCTVHQSDFKVICKQYY